MINLKKLTFKRGFLIFTILFFIVLVLAAQNNKTGYIVPENPMKVEENQTLTYFYYWYDLPNGPHSTALTDVPADEDTSYKNVSWFEKQLVDMQEAGIDTALAVYWGEKEESSKPGLTNLVKARSNLISRGEGVPKIGLFFDTGLFGQLPKSQRNLTSKKGKERFYNYIKEFYQKVPRDYWGLINQKPVVWLYGNYFEIEFDQTTFDFIYSSFEKDFGIRPYIVREASWNYPQKESWSKIKVDFSKPIFTDNYYEWGASYTGFKDVGGVFAVGPGYDERDLPDPKRQGLYRSRENGRWFRENLMKAISQEKKLIVIETWNEFHEASDIAESKEYGRQYIEISKEYLQNY